jgi:hypothetical protein
MLVDDNRPMHSLRDHSGWIAGGLVPGSRLWEAIPLTQSVKRSAFVITNGHLTNASLSESVGTRAVAAM